MLKQIHRMFTERLSGSTDSSIRTRRARRSLNRLEFQSLEQRNLLAGIYFDSASGTLTVSGTPEGDTGQLVLVGKSNVKASLSGLPDRSFSTSEVERLVFIGFDGNDSFENLTSIPSRLLGGNGDDTLRGGSGEDIINGGQGDDELYGMESADRIVGYGGDDTIHGNGDNDLLFGGAGANEIYGGDGNDLIFGGDEEDRIYGESGIDSIFGLDGNDFLDAGDGGVVGSTDIYLADLILGHGGDDEFAGGEGLNVFYGGDGNDRMIGGSGENRMHGQNGDDFLLGGESADYLAGQNGDDWIAGGAGNDYMVPGFGDDIIHGGSGTDFVAYSAQYSDYELSISGSNFRIDLPATAGADGSDTVRNAEGFRFVGKNVSADDILDEGLRIVTVQPIIVSNDDGSNTAEFFGTAAQEAAIKQKIDEIFADAGVDIEWADANEMNSTNSNVGHLRKRNRMDLHDITWDGFKAGVTGRHNEIDMYFIEVAPGFRDTGERTVNGAALRDLGETTIHVGDKLPSTEAGRDYIAREVAQTIGHNLGLFHSENADNLMLEGKNDGTGLQPNQIKVIRESQLAGGSRSSH